MTRFKGVDAVRECFWAWGVSGYLYIPAVEAVDDCLECDQAWGFCGCFCGPAIKAVEEQPLLEGFALGVVVIGDGTAWP